MLRYAETEEFHGKRHSAQCEQNVSDKAGDENQCEMTAVPGMKMKILDAVHSVALQDCRENAAGKNGEPQAESPGRLLPCPSRRHLRPHPSFEHVYEDA